MKTPAAVLVEVGQPLVLAELEVPPLKAGQALVEVVFSGVCHTQVLECRGHRGEDRYLPHCLGHEGSGTVREAGPGVTKVRPGDRVILSWIKGAGAETGGSVYSWNGRPVNAGAITTFQRYSIISENRLTVLPVGISFEVGALLGCAIPTGLGAVLNTAQARPGQSLAVFGIGGVGLCAVAGASLRGCHPVVAVDIRPEKLDLARQAGATHELLAREEDPVQAILKICPGGLDIAVEASGRPQAMAQALEAVRPRGGTAVVVGNARRGERLELDPWQLNLGKRLLGTWGGDHEPERDYPRYFEMVSSGNLRLESLLSSVYPLSRANEALFDLEAGRAPRPILDAGAEG